MCSHLTHCCDCLQADLVGVAAEVYRQGVQAQVEELLPDLAYPPVVPVCSLTGYGVEELMYAVSCSTYVPLLSTVRCGSHVHRLRYRLVSLHTSCILLLSDDQ
jgi:hypothetical protein